MIVAISASLALAGPTASKNKPLSSKESASLREQARSLLTAGELEKVAKLIDRARTVTATTERAVWLLIESECEYARRAWAKSALAAMQIVILHPKSEHGGSALYWAARAYEQIGRPVKSADLYRECVDHKRTPAGLRDAAKARLTDLTKQVENWPRRDSKP